MKWVTMLAISFMLAIGFNLAMDSSVELVVVDNKDVTLIEEQSPPSAPTGITGVQVMDDEPVCFVQPCDDWTVPVGYEDTEVTDGVSM